MNGGQQFIKGGMCRIGGDNCEIQSVVLIPYIICYHNSRQYAYVILLPLFGMIRQTYKSVLCPKWTVTDGLSAPFISAIKQRKWESKIVHRCTEGISFKHKSGMH